MTICIGCLCDERKNAIAIMDRMVTSGYPPQEFEHEISKMNKLSNTCVALAAGTVPQIEHIINNVKSETEKLSSPKISEIAEITKDQYIKYKRKIASEDYLEPYDLDLNIFYRSGLNIPPALYTLIHGAIESIDIIADFLIIGCDDGGSHLYSISERKIGGIKVSLPGLLHPHNTLGFAAVGSGELQANTQFIQKRYTYQKNLEEAIETIYGAKKMAEVAPGVGKETDIVIITKEGIEEPSQKMMENVIKQKQIQ